ncbi:S1 family peptidase [Glutamicibacter sp. MCAF14]|uniref:S1 family peptidase n=1 Tax=Glutamicibacter sp. MCAF14 TaxID=3233043 RepID=UPI003F90511B
MPHPKKKTAQRGIVAAAATALVVGSSFMPALAAPTASESPSASASASAKASANTSASATPSESALDTKGLDKAIERDLDKTVEEFVEQGDASDAASKVRDELEAKGVDATASVKDGKAEITVGKKDVAKAKEVIKASAAPAPIVVTEVDSEVKTVGKVYTELLANIEPKEMKRLTAILQTKDGLKVYAKGFDEKEVKAELKSKSAGTLPEKLTVEQFVSEANHVGGVESSGVAKTTAAEDIYGALGYAMDQSGALTGSSTVCSLGFTAWTAEGDDAIVSAGHCSEDGTTKILGLAEQSVPGQVPTIGAELGDFGFNQFGGPNNSGFTVDELNSMTEEEFNSLEPGTDISVIDNINPALNMHPAVSKWPAGKEPRDEVINVTGMTKAIIGSEACSSGRTTGWSCSPIIGEGVFFVGGSDGTYRSVAGYVAENAGQKVLDQGDSGGPMLVGSRAAGINSANAEGEDLKENTDDDIAMYTSLDDVFDKGYIDGYTLKFHVNTPNITVENGTEVEPGDAITGTMVDPSKGTVIRVIVDGKLYKTVELEANGTFSFPAPEEPGKFEFSLVAKDGYNQSEKVSGNVVVVEPAVEPETPEEEPTEPETPEEEPTEPETPEEEPTEPETPEEEPTESETPEEDDKSETPEDDDKSEAPKDDDKSETPEDDDKSETPKDDDKSEAPKDQEDDEPTKSTTPKETPKKDDPLADTGANSVPLIAAGGAMALAGAAFLLFRRSARRHG